MSKEKIGFDGPQYAKPGWAQRLKEKHGFSHDASLDDMEDKITELLASPQTVIGGAELLLGRRVDSNDGAITKILFLNTTPEDKFGILLIQKATEKMMMINVEDNE